MRYIIYELRKLAGMRYIWVFFIVLFSANITLAAYTANQKVKWQVSSDIVIGFFDEYSANPEWIESEYADLTALINERNIFLRDAMQSRDFDYEPEPLPNKYTDNERYDDNMLFNEIFNRKSHIFEYPFVTNTVIDRAYSNIAELDFAGISNDSYLYQYQLKVIDLYRAAQSNVEMKLEYSRGWGDYFNYDIVNIFVFAILIVFGSVLFAQEKNSGFLSIIRTAKNGGIKMALVKIGTMLILTFAIVFVFTFSTMAVFGIILGFSSLDNAIQIFEEFVLCPAVITVGQYFFIDISVKFLVFSLFSCIIMLISIFISNYAITYICGFGLFGLNFLFYTIQYFSADNVFKNLNFVSVAAVKPLFIRYRALNFFGNLIGYIPFMLIVFGTLLFIVSAVTIVIFSRGRARTIDKHFVVFTIISNEIKALLFNIAKKISATSPKKRGYSLSIFSAEVYKTLIIKRYIFIIIGILIVKLYTSNSEFTALNSYSDTVYKEYMTILQGELTDKKREFISAEREFINDILIKQDEMLEKYLLEEISFDEYREYLTNYNYAYSRNEIFAVIENHLYYIEQTTAIKNINTWFVYDTGWKKLFHSGFDIILYSLILLLFAGIFADEYTEKSSSGSFIQILRTTKNGRKRTFRAKLTSALVITTILTIIFNSIDLILIFKNYHLPASNAPLLSLQTFSNISSSITVSQYLAAYLLIKLFANILFTVFLCGLSELLKKSILVMSVSVAITLFPALFVYLGLNIFNYFDFTALLSGTQLYLLSARTNIFGDMGLFIILALSYMIIFYSILFKSEKNYIK
jgi:hypothetical protein